MTRNIQIIWPAPDMRRQEETIRFTAEEVSRAHAAWGFNCGPAAMAAILGLTPDELRPSLLDFERKGYTNPMLMKSILGHLGVRFHQVYRSDNPGELALIYGLMCVQWAGPWTRPGVPMRVRNRKTHWVGVRTRNNQSDIFDINAMCVGGWLPLQEWSAELVPWLMREVVPDGDGKWWPTHGIEVWLR